MQSGQSLIELLVAMAIFVTVIGSISFLILDSYASLRLSEEITKANFLAEEGLETSRSIRDNSWSELSSGSHGLVISGNNWVFQGTEEDISSQLPDGKRKIIVEEISPYRKKITSLVTWQSREISLVTYLTNWENPFLPYLSQLHYRWRADDGGE